jgi:hypothetical protein
LRTKTCFCALDGDIFDFVNIHAAGVKSLAGISFDGLGV